ESRRVPGNTAARGAYTGRGRTSEFLAFRRPEANAYRTPRFAILFSVIRCRLRWRCVTTVCSRAALLSIACRLDRAHPRESNGFAHSFGRVPRADNCEADLARAQQEYRRVC